MQALKVIGVFATALAYFFALLTGNLDWAYWGLIWLFAGGAAFVIGGLSYGVFLGRKTLKAAKEQIQHGRPASQPGGDSGASKVFGYFKWQFACFVFTGGIAALYKILE